MFRTYTDLALSEDRSAAYTLANDTRDLLRVDLTTFVVTALGRGDWQAIAAHRDVIACAGRDVSIVDRDGRIRTVLQASGARLEKVVWSADGESDRGRRARRIGVHLAPGPTSRRGVATRPS